jgi:general stress protein CsbA
MGVLLIAAPWLFGFNDMGAARWVPIVLGVALLATSPDAAYELGLIKAIPMPVHLGLDVLVGLVLIASPWLFGFADELWLPHVIVGVLEVGAGLCTQTRPSFAEASAAGRTGRAF